MGRFGGLLQGGPLLLGRILVLSRVASWLLNLGRRFPGDGIHGFLRLLLGWGAESLE